MSLAQTKVVERSAKKAPEWVNTANPSALVVTVTANTIADAQVKAMAEVTERIILSVASNSAPTAPHTRTHAVTRTH